MLSNFLKESKLPYKKNVNITTNKNNQKKSQQYLNTIQMYFFCILILIHENKNIEKSISINMINQDKWNSLLIRRLDEFNIAPLLNPIKNKNSMGLQNFFCLVFLKKVIKKTHRRLKKVLVNLSLNKKLKKNLSRFSKRRKKNRLRIKYPKWRIIKKKIRNLVIRKLKQRSYGKKKNSPKVITNYILIFRQNRKIWNKKPKNPPLKKNIFMRQFTLHTQLKKTRKPRWPARNQTFYYTNAYNAKLQKKRAAFRFKKNYLLWLATLPTPKCTLYKNYIQKRRLLQRSYILSRWVNYTLKFKKKRSKISRVKKAFKIRANQYLKRLKLRFYKYSLKSLFRSNKFFKKVITNNRFNKKKSYFSNIITKTHIKTHTVELTLPSIVFSRSIDIRNNNHMTINTLKNIYYQYKKKKFERKFRWSSVLKTLKSSNRKSSKTRRNVKIQVLKKLFTLNCNDFIINRNLQSHYINNLSQFNLSIFKKGWKTRYTFKKLIKIFRSKKLKNNKLKKIPKVLNLISNIYKKPRQIRELFNNYLPLFLFFNNYNSVKSASGVMSKKNLHFFYNRIRTGVTTQFKNFFVFYLINFLENFLKKKIWIRLNTKNCLSLFWRKYINRFFKKNWFKYKQFAHLISIKELLEVIVISFVTQDLQIFLKFVKKKLEKSHFKKHKKILLIIFGILKNNPLIFKITPIKGFSFDIRGKVGVSGNAKKRHVFFSFGKISTTSQNLKSYWQQIEVWTPTGQMGITCLLQY